MNKFCGIISYLCGSVAIALLAIALITGGGRQAWATDCASCGTAPTPVMPGDPAYPAYQMAYATYSSCIANCTTTPPPCNCGPQPTGNTIGTVWYYCMMTCNTTAAISCDDPNTVVCKNEAGENATKCHADSLDAEGAGKACDKKNTKCLCRFSKTKQDCTCGLAVGT